MTFTESNTIEAFIRDQLCGGVTHHTAVGPGLARRNRQVSGLGWHYFIASILPRQPREVLVDDHLRNALIRLNPSIAAQPDPVDDMLYSLLAIVISVRDTGFVIASEMLADLRRDVSSLVVFA